MARKSLTHTLCLLLFLGRWLLIRAFPIVPRPRCCDAAAAPCWTSATNENNNTPLRCQRSWSATRRSATTPASSYQEDQVELDTGVSMKVTWALPTSKPSKPLLLFLHGSFHGGWCWTEHYFGHFVGLGYPCVAPCWRGTGGTFAGEGVKKVQIQQHVADFQSLLDQLPSLVGNEQLFQQKPIVIAHSFGSLAVMKLLEMHPERLSQFGGIVMMCGVPPSGNGKMTMRYLRRSWKDSYKITVGFAMKKCLQNEALCRDLFLGGPKLVAEDGRTVVDDHGVSDADVVRYQRYFARDSQATIDLMDLAKQLPSFGTVEDGKAPFYQDLPPCLVLGATRDFIVDREGVEETARYFDVDRPVYVESPHDVMLTRQWRNAADELEQWLEKNTQLGLEEPKKKV